MEDQNKHICTMEDKISKFMDDIKTSIRWTIGVSAGFILLIVVGVTETRSRQSTTEKIVERINDEYVPLFIMRAITGSNDRLIDVITSLPTNTKDDDKYKAAIKSRDDFQREILQLAAESKRGGGGSPGSSSNNSK
jgi:hypothetical protein